MHQDRIHLQAGVADLQQPMLMLACLVVSDVGRYVGHLFCGQSRHVYNFLNGCVMDDHMVYVVYNLDNPTLQVQHLATCIHLGCASVVDLSCFGVPDTLGTFSKIHRLGLRHRQKY